MRLARLLPALAAALTATIAFAAAPTAAEPAVAPATLFFPRTVARAEERAAAGTAAWRMIDLGPTRALEAVVTFPGEAADMIVLIEENPFAGLPDDILVHAWPRWPDTAEGAAVPSAYLVGVETPAEAQIGLIGTARGDFTIGLMESAAARNHERLRAASVMIVELSLPDGKAYVSLIIGEDQRRLIEDIIPPDGPALPFAGAVEQRILGANAPDGTGGVLWDTSRGDDGAVAARARVYLYDRAIGFEVTFEAGPQGLVVLVDSGDAAIAPALGSITGMAFANADGETPLTGGLVLAGNGTSSITYTGGTGHAALDLLAGAGASGAMLILTFDGSAAGPTPVALALPQSWNPFASLATAP